MQNLYQRVKELYFNTREGVLGGAAVALMGIIAIAPSVAQAGNIEEHLNIPGQDVVIAQSPGSRGNLSKQEAYKILGIVGKEGTYSSFGLSDSKADLEYSLTTDKIGGKNFRRLTINLVGVFQGLSLEFLADASTGVVRELNLRAPTNRYGTSSKYPNEVVVYGKNFETGKVRSVGDISWDKKRYKVCACIVFGYDSGLVGDFDQNKANKVLKDLIALSEKRKKVKS